MIFKAGLVTMFLVLICPYLLYADIKQGAEFSFYGGRLLANGGITGERADDSRTINTSINDGSAFGLRAGYNFNPFLGLEVTLGGSTNDYVFRLTDESMNPPSDVSIEETTELFFLHCNGVLHLLKGWFVPFVTAGIGGFAYVDDYSFSTNFGGGIKLFITDRIALRLDWRQYYSEVKGSTSPIWAWSGIEPGKEFSYSEDLKFQEIGLSISFLTQ